MVFEGGMTLLIDEVATVELEPAACQLARQDGRVPRRGELERNPQPEANGTAIVDTLLGEGLQFLPKILVGSDVGN